MAASWRASMNGFHGNPGARACAVRAEQGPIQEIAPSARTRRPRHVDALSPSTARAGQPRPSAPPSPPAPLAACAPAARNRKPGAPQPSPPPPSARATRTPPPSSSTPSAEHGHLQPLPDPPSSATSVPSSSSSSSSPLPSSTSSSIATATSPSAGGAQALSSALAPAPADAVSDSAGLSPELLQHYRLSARQHRQLEIYLDYLLEVNQSMNLTAVRDKGDAWQRHVMDSLALLPVIDRHYGPEVAPSSSPPPPPPVLRDRIGGAAAAGRRSGSRSGGDGIDDGDQRIRSGEGASSSSSGKSSSASSSSGGSGSSGSSGSSGRSGGSEGVALRLVDVGTGAGLPGMVLAVARPEWKVTLLDSLRKRCDFLREAAARAGLGNVEVVWCRAEEGGRRPELRQAYDIAVARAVAEARVLAELCLPFVRLGGLWVAAKGPDPEVEVAAAGSAIRQLGGRLLALERVDSHSAEGQRTALVVAKTCSTPARFPRAPGTPSKKPL